MPYLKNTSGAPLVGVQVTVDPADLLTLAADEVVFVTDDRLPVVQAAFPDLTEVAGIPAGASLIGAGVPSVKFGTAAGGTPSAHAPEHESGGSDPLDLGSIAGTVDYATQVSGKPATFTPSSHTHVIADTTGLQTALDAKAAASHTHAQADVTDLVTDLAAKVEIGGQLGGSATSPDVRGIRETSGPQLLTVGAIANGDFLKRVGTDIVGAAAPAGETNTASNVGAAGVGVFKQKTGVDLEFKKLNAGSSKVTITDDTGNSEIDIDVSESNLSLQNLGGVLPAFASPRKSLGIQADYNTTSSFTFGMSSAFAAAVGGAGGTSALLDTTGSYIVLTNGAANGNSSSIATAAARTRRALLPDAAFAIKTGASITSTRLWVGFFSGDPTASADPALHLAAFRYDTAADGTAFWRYCTKDGSTMNAQASAVAVTGNTRYELRIQCVDASTVRFFIDGVLVGTSTTNLPTSTTDLFLRAGITNLAASAREIRWGRIELLTN